MSGKIVSFVVAGQTVIHFTSDTPKAFQIRPQGTPHRAFEAPLHFIQ
jgi:hypothetical protein